MDRFWLKVDKSAGEDGCWPWQASKNVHGYGKFKDRGTVRNASRVAWEIATGRKCYGLVVRHTCDNPACCNPAHLIPGTQSQNINDAVRRGRHRSGAATGEANPRAKLSAKQVAEIRERIAAGESNRSIAQDYHVSDSQISRIKVGRSW